MAILKSGRRRVKLTGAYLPEVIAKLEAGKRKAQAEAPRQPNGKMMRDYKYRRLIDGFGGVTKTFGGKPSLYKDPLFITDPTVAKRIVKFIGAGYPYTTVCNLVGVKVSTLMHWLERGKTGFSEDYVRFYKAVCRAEAKGEMAIMRKLRKHSSADWRVSAWQLERIWPEKYGRVDRIRAETRSTISVTTDAKKVLSTKVVEDDVARELARRMIDQDAQLNFNALPSPEPTGPADA